MPPHETIMSHLATPIVEVEVDRHGGVEAPTEPPPKPSLGGPFELDGVVIRGLLSPVAIDAKVKLTESKSFPSPAPR